jgi:hypothetical protein
VSMSTWHAGGPRAPPRSPTPRARARLHCALSHFPSTAPAAEQAHALASATARQRRRSATAECRCQSVHRRFTTASTPPHSPLARARASITIRA